MLTPEVFDQMARDDRWLGHGYLGARRNARATSDLDAIVDPALIVEADDIAIEAANNQGMSYDTLFEWANSKVGRWFGDTIFGGGSREQIHQVLPGVSLDLD